MSVPVRAPEGVLLLDKPAGITSTRALATAKRLLGSRKAGHTGTLDPFATGLLPLVFGEATKFSRFLLDSTKGYHATLRLGEETASGDTESPVGETREVACGEAEIAAVVSAFTGSLAQVPPMHSAVRVGGKRLYDLARAGEEVERAPRTVIIERLEVLGRTGNDLRVAVTCSKGTYVRTLAVDMGRALGCGAHLVALRRVTVGAFSIDQASNLGEMEANSVEWRLSRLLPVESLVASLPRWRVPREAAVRFVQGQDLAEAPAAPGVEVAVFGPGDRLVGVGLVGAAGQLAPARLMSFANPKSPDFA